MKRTQALGACGSSPPPSPTTPACHAAIDKAEGVMLLSSDAIATLAGTDNTLIKLRTMEALIDRLEPAMSEYVDDREECLDV